MVDLVVLNFEFDFVPRFYLLKWNRYFSACKWKWNAIHVILEITSSFTSDFRSIFSAIKHNSSTLFLAQTLYTLVKNSSLKYKFLRFLSWSKFVKFLMSILNWQVNSFSNFTSFFNVMTHNSPVSFKLIHFLLWIKGSHQSPNPLTFKRVLVKIC